MGKPYLPTTHDAAAAAASSVVSSATAAAAVSLPPSEWLFQPIAEDEPGFDEETLEAIIAGAAPAAAAAANEVDTTKVCTLGYGTLCMAAQNNADMYSVSTMKLASFRNRLNLARSEHCHKLLRLWRSCI